VLFSLLVCALGGILAGTFSGLLGIGGGILIVPLLIYLLPIMGLPAEVVVPTAIATSLGTIMATTFSGMLAHHKRGYVDWKWARLLSPFLIVGGLAGAWMGSWLNPDLLRRIFAFILLLLAIRMVWKHQPKAVEKRIRPWVVRFWSTGIGIISALVGIGGGALVVPFLSFYQLAMRNAVAVAAVCSVLLSATGAITYAILGSQAHDAQVPGLIGFVYLPALLAISATSVIFARVGASLAHRLPVRYLQRGFAVLLIAVSIHLLISG